MRYFLKARYELRKVLIGEYGNIKKSRLNRRFYEGDSTDIPLLYDIDTFLILEYNLGVGTKDIKSGGGALLDFILRYWVQFGFGLIIAMLGVVLKWLRERLNDSAIIKSATVAILRNDIISIFQTCECRDSHYFPLHERENLDDLYKQYKALKGNGAIEDIVTIMKGFPVRDNCAMEDKCVRCLNLQVDKEKMLEGVLGLKNDFETYRTTHRK